MKNTAFQIAVIAAFSALCGVIGHQAAANRAAMAAPTAVAVVNLPGA
jgi:hypothetical protein